MREIPGQHTSQNRRVPINPETNILSSREEKGSDGGYDVVSTSDYDATPTNSDVDECRMIENWSPVEKYERSIAGDEAKNKNAEEN